MNRWCCYFIKYINIDTDEYILNENFKEEAKKFKRLYFKFINDKVLKI
jgi:hypothetical protein